MAQSGLQSSLVDWIVITKQNWALAKLSGFSVIVGDIW